MSKGYLHCSVVFKAGNLNYGESIGNIMSLKRITIEEKSFPYQSRQAIRYDIVRTLEECGYSMVGKDDISKEKKVIQFTESATIDKYPEIDFFGYMKTEKKSKKQSKNDETDDDSKDQQQKIRKAPVRLTDAISLEPFYNEIDFSTNAGLASRIGENNDIYQSEIHRSYYTYSITVDLDKIGVDENYNIELSKEERIKRLNALLYAVKVLNRDIKGKRENLSPLFVIGGIYKSGNPFFYNQIKLSFEDGISIDEQIINSILEITMFSGEKVKDTTYLGFAPSYFNSIDKINLDSSRKLTIEEFFKTLGSSVADYYLNTKEYQPTTAVNPNNPKIF